MKRKVLGSERTILKKSKAVIADFCGKDKNFTINPYLCHMKILFRLRYDSHWGEDLFLTGDTSSLGHWNPDKAIPMQYVGPGIWSVAVETQDVASKQYKYFIRENGQIRWEDGPNRMLPEGKARVWDWFRLTKRQTMKGVAVPLFSLRTKDDFGIGEFADLPKLGEWCISKRLDIIQILPINDTTAQYDWHDSYPYNAISAFALNPIYLNLNKLGIGENATFRKEKDKLNGLDFVDYPKVLRTKWKYFNKAFKEQWTATKETADFHHFYKENEDWLPEYAHYCSERDGNGTDIHLFLQYHCDKQLREAVGTLHDKGLLLKGDIPIGVNPEGVDVKSHPELFNQEVQVGAPPDDFSADGQNWGFPAYNWDAMAKDGYAWWQRRLQVMARYFSAYRIDHILGFFRIWEIPKHLKSGLMGCFSPALPLSEEEIRRHGFAFEAQKHADQGIDTLFVSDPYQKGRYHPRIALQRTNSYKALDGSQKTAIDNLYEEFFYHRHNEFWKQKALEKLPALVNATAMTACGEDLGMIPATVPEVMQRLGIMSLEVERMPKISGHDFVEKEDLPENCVYTTGTHDMPSLRGWLAEDRERTRQFLDHLDIDDREVTASTIRKVLEKHADSPSKWNIYPMQDLLDTDAALWSPDPNADQINIPANAENHWRWRMSVLIETLLP